MLDALENLVTGDTVEEVWSEMNNFYEGFGFDRVMYGFTRFMTGNSLGETEDSMIMSNHPEDYLRVFFDKGLYYEAPMVKWAANNNGACSWSRIYELAQSGVMSEAERKVMEFNRRFNVVAGYTIAFKDSSTRAKGALGMAAKPGITQAEVDETWENHGREIMLFSNVAHLKMVSLPYKVARRSLTPRQREALEWVGEGKTTQDIATIMGLTSATIEKHLRLAREALNVETTAQAVLKASYQNQIFNLQPEA